MTQQVVSVGGSPVDVLGEDFAVKAAMRRFTPNIQTKNGDLNIGDAGAQSGAFWIVGNVLHVKLFVSFAGSGVSPGTGDLLLPFPPGFDVNDVNASDLPLLAEDVGVAEAVTQTQVTGTLDGTQGLFYAPVTIEQSEATPADSEAQWQLDLSDVTAGDAILVDYCLPLGKTAFPAP